MSSIPQPAGAFLCRVCMFIGYPASTRVQMHACQVNWYSKSAIGVNGCLFFCVSPAIEWQLGVPHLSSTATHHHHPELDKRKRWMHYEFQDTVTVCVCVFISVPRVQVFIFVQINVYRQFPELHSSWSTLCPGHRTDGPSRLFLSVTLALSRAHCYMLTQMNITTKSTRLLLPAEKSTYRHFSDCKKVWDAD